MAPGTRDLSSTELWHDSLERSQRRRELSELARKHESRKKSASLAVTAAMATTPVAPTFTTFGGDGPSRASASHTRILEKRDDAKRVLLERGMSSAAVIEVQEELKIAQDGVFGPVTERAVKRFQAKHGLPPTGKIDVRTWLTLFPDGMVVYDAANHRAELAAEAPKGAEQGPAGSAPISPANLVAPDGPGETAQDRAVAAAQVRAGGAPQGVEAHEGILPDRDAERGKAREGSRSERRSGRTRDTVAGVVEERGRRSGSSGSGRSDSRGGSSGGGPVGGPINVAPGLGSAQEMIAAMIAAADRIDKARYPYRWGGGHNARFSGPYDCSGAVSAVLRAAGLLDAPMVSGQFMRWGRPGPGAVTIYANAGHMYMSINGRFWGTSRSNPGGGAGWFNGSKRPGYAVVHVPFEAMKFKKSSRRKAKTQATRTRTRAATASQEPAASGSGASGSTAQRDTQSGGTTYGSGSGQTAQASDGGTTAQQPAQQAPAQQAPAEQTAPAQQAPAQEPAPAQAAPAPEPAAAPAQAAPAPVADAAPAAAPAPAPAPVAETAPSPEPAAPAAEAPAAEPPAAETPAAEAPAADAAVTAAAPTDAATESKGDSADEQTAGE